MPDTPAVSIVVPVLNEAGCLDRNLARLFEPRFVREACEIIVSDGGSRDASLDIAARYDCKILRGEAGRAAQMNRGAAAASGEYLLFLHADSLLPRDFEARFPPSADWGFFRLRLDHDAVAYRVIESAVNWRSRLTRIAGGDQGLFFRREFFERLGGFPPIPLMEDIAICKSARRLSAPMIIASAMRSSSRRWQQRGLVKTVLLMWSLRLAFWAGIDPVRLHRIYYPQPTRR